MAEARRIAGHVRRPLASSRRLTRHDLFLHPRRFRGRHHAAAIVVFVVLAALAFQLFPSRSVTVLSDGRAVRVSATFDPMDEALDAAHVEVGAGDRIYSGSGGNHSSVAVQRARVVRLSVDGSMFELRTQRSTVSGALAEAGIELRDGDRIYLDGQLTSARGPLTGTVFAAAPTTAAAASQVSGPGDSASDPVLVAIVRARPVTIVLDDIPTVVNSAASTVETLLFDHGLRVKEGDLVQPSLDTPVVAGMTIRLEKAVTVTLRLNGTDEVFYTRAETVAQVLALYEIELGPEDSVSHPPETPLTRDMTLVVALTRTVEEQTTVPIEPGIRYVTDASLSPGQVRIVQGTPGERVRVELVTYKNGVEVGRETAPGGGIVTNPVDTVHHVGPATDGTSSHPTIDAPGFSGTYSRKLTVWATWYNASHGGKSKDHPGYGLTYTEIPLAKGICAVDPDVIPLYTRFWVEGYGECLAADIGGGVRGNHVDLGFPEGHAPVPWATGYVDIYIID